MAKFVVETTPEEQAKVMEILVKLQGQTVPVSAIAEQAGLRQSRARYAIADLIEAGKVRKVASKAFNKHYVRYTYEIL